MEHSQSFEQNKIQNVCKAHDEESLYLLHLVIINKCAFIDVVFQLYLSGIFNRRRTFLGIFKVDDFFYNVR